MKNFDSNVLAQKRAEKVLPLGVNSNFRYWGEGITPYVKKAKGAHLWDVAGNEYIDYRMAFGPIILGHAFDAVDEKVIEEVRNGVLFAMTGELELDVAEMIVSMCPSVEMVRMACSGTEATMHAIRVARAYTGREVILKFEGNYHGSRHEQPQRNQLGRTAFATELQRDHPSEASNSESCNQKTKQTRVHKGKTRV